MAQGLLILAATIGSSAPGRIGAVVIGAGTAAAADTVDTYKHNDIGALVAVLGLAFIALLAHQLVRGRHRTRVVDSLTSGALLVVAVAGLSVPLELRRQVDGPAMATAVLLCITAALVVGHLVDWVWSPVRFDPRISRGLPAVVAAVAAGTAVSVARLRDSVEFTGQRAAILGAAVALVAALLAVGAAFMVPAPSDPGPSRPVRSARLITPTLVAFALSAPLAYLLCLALRG